MEISRLQGFNSNGEKIFACALRPACLRMGSRPTLPETIMDTRPRWVCPFLRSQLKNWSAASRRSGDGVDYVAVFNSVNAVVDGPFSRLESTTVFGGAEYDLRDARVERPPAVIDVTCLFGGAELRVPEDWIVHNDVLALFGGVDDKRRGSSADGDVTVTIRGTVMFGGLTIRD